MNRSEMMAAVHSKDTQPEMIIRRYVHSLGYRYRLHRADLPGKPDLVFGPKKKVIFVHGCFWHQHGCKGSHLPKSNTDYWEPKLSRNIKRDAENMLKLIDNGWSAIIIWECELKDMDLVKKKIRDFLR